MNLPLYEHINELRRMVVLIIIFLAVFFIIGYSLSNLFILHIITSLILGNVKLVSLSPVEYILAQIKVGFIIGFAATFPIIIYQGLVFVKPGLKKGERNAIKLVLPTFVLLFLMGIAFSYYILFPVGLLFLGSLGKGVVENMWSIGRFLDFVLLGAFSMGLIFEMPLLVSILGRLGIINKKVLRRYRPHVIVLIFIFAGVITPPDIITQIIVGLPLVLLYEISLLLIR
jgi:sec-independent protein translocase protein TatC